MLTIHLDSHVPIERRVDHWALVRRALGPGGRVVIIDNAHPTTSATSGFARLSTPGEGGRERRRLADGREYEIVKHYLHPAELEAEGASGGVALRAATTDHWFLHAHGTIDSEPTP